MSTTADAGSVWRRRLDLAVPTAFLVALAFVQRPGWTAADTKLDLTVDPGGFLVRALSLWDPLAAGGQLQNQAYGYLFPMGPFFWVGHALHVPAWVVQRLWWALILVLAYHGTRLVLERLGVGTGWSRVIGAMSYALAPRMVVGLGAISSEIWPMALAPWVLLPLLAVAPGRERPAALRSGVAVLLLGAVNAVASIAVLVLPFWWIITRRGAVRWRLLAWWSLAVVLATAWWVGPLLLLGRYSPPFLNWIEDARVTTAVASVTEALRGTTQWIAGIGGSQNAVWPAGWLVLTSRNIILFGLVVVLAGLLGLALARGPWVGFARGGLVLGLLFVTFGHVGGVAAPWSGAEADLLDAALAPFRNTHKFEPVLRLPLALGVAHGLPPAVEWLRRRHAPWPLIAPAVVVLALIGQTAVPAFVGVIQRGEYLAVPAAWSETATWLDEHPDGGRALLLPGGNAPARLWGEPKDEPLQPVASQPWIVRDAVPLGSAAATRILNEIEQRVSQGRGGPELLAMLDSLAVTRVVLVGDHQRLTSRTTPPVVVRAALVASGARSVVSFGEIVGGSTDVGVASDWGLDRPAREIEVFAVRTLAGIAPSSLVPVSRVPRYVGGPEGVAAVPGLPPGLFAADPASEVGGDAVVLSTDTLQRRQASFATSTDLYGPLLSADEAYPSPRPVHDYWPDPLTEADPELADHQSVRSDDGAARAEASSTLADPALGQGRELASDAWRAFDVSGVTAWRSSGYDPEGQWVQVRWADPTELPAELTLTLDTEIGADVAAVSITTEAGEARTPVTSPTLAGEVDPARYEVEVEVPPGATRSVRLTIEAVREGRPTVRVRDLGAGVLPRVTPFVRLPVTSSSPQVISVQASLDSRPACYPLSSGVLACSPDRRRVGEEETTMRRVVTTAQDRTFSVRGTAAAIGVGADDLLRRLDGVRASGSSRWLQEPGVSPELAVDGDPGTYWAADPDDAEPTLTLSWPTPRAVRGLRIAVDADAAGRRPTEVDVILEGQTYHRVLDRDGSISLPEARTRGLRLVVTDTTSQDSLTASGERPMPVVVGDVSLEGDSWLPIEADAPVVVPCGFGPTLQVNGATYPTTVTTTRGVVLARGDATVRVCGEMSLAAGEQRIQVLASRQFAVRSLLLDGRGPTAAGGTGGVATPVRVIRWGATDRSVELARAVPGDSLLVVRENANAGWVARLGDEQLRPVRADGWAQAWVVPAGSSGVVRMSFEPQGPFQVSLLLGALLAMTLLAVAVVTRGGPPGPVLAETRLPALGRALTVAAVVAVGGGVGAVASGLALAARRVRAGLVLAVTALLALAWVGWVLLRPWPSGGTNRDIVSGGLALLLVAIAATWSGGGAADALTGAAAGPGLDGRLEEVPAQGRDEERRAEGEHDGDPEAGVEQAEPQEPAHREHHGQVPQEHAIAHRADVGEHRVGEHP